MVSAGAVVHQHTTTVTHPTLKQPHNITYTVQYCYTLHLNNHTTSHTLNDPSYS